VRVTFAKTGTNHISHHDIIKKLLKSINQMKFGIVQVTTNLVNEGREPLTNKNNGLIFYKESE